MEQTDSLQRFLSAQEKQYHVALAELKRGQKQTHWMWYIFPQIAGLGFSETSAFFALRHLKEAQEYLDHPLLGKRLIELSEILLTLTGKTAREIFHTPDDLKLRSCMTLFAALPHSPPVFQQVLDKYFEGATDQATLRLIKAG